MKKFNKIIFWCEFPKEVKWNKLNDFLDFNIDIYIAVNSIKEFNYWKSKIKSKYVKTIGAWPLLDIKEGYWFSGYSSKENIDKLIQFKGIPMKIDLEPPLLGKEYSFLGLIYKYSKFFLTKKPNNKEYLNKIIRDLSKKSEIIVSGFPFPKMLEDFYIKEIKSEKNIAKNYFIYSTLIPKVFHLIARLYNKNFIKNKINEDKYKLMFAVGCIGHGIFGNEPSYKNNLEFERDMLFLLKNNVKNMVVFDLAGIMNRKNPEKWFRSIKKNINTNK